MKPRRLPRSFYRRDDVVMIARELLGKALCTRFNGRLTSGWITETEAYAGVVDRASHAWAGRRTARNEVMYGAGGVAYVYLCYGIHHLFNVVTHGPGVPHAVLVRAIEPVDGVEVMRRRRSSHAGPFTTGPGTLSQALGIHTRHSGTDLLGDRIWIEDRAIAIAPEDIIAGPRVGVRYAGEHALLPYRFRIVPDVVASLP